MRLDATRWMNGEGDTVPAVDPEDEDFLDEDDDDIPIDDDDLIDEDEDEDDEVNS